jgi:hypothetical protein
MSDEFTEQPDDCQLRRHDSANMKYVNGDNYVDNKFPGLEGSPDHELQ